ncbi:hypothetical protein AA19596_1358 [Acetobacter fabarum DSM 19596]|nr:hypothetical protein AA19596_1358 [Acetobacter fabarum DSM 19596]
MGAETRQIRKGLAKPVKSSPAKWQPAISVSAMTRIRNGIRNIQNLNYAVVL